MRRMGDTFLGCVQCKSPEQVGDGGGSFNVCREEWKLIVGV